MPKRKKGRSKAPQTPQGERKRTLYDRATDQIPTGVPKDYRKVLEVAKEQQFRFLTGKGYPQAIPPDPEKRPVAIPMTPQSHGNALENWIRQMRQAGLKY